MWGGSARKRCGFFCTCSTWKWESTVLLCKVDFQSVLRRLNDFFFKNYLRHVRLYEMYQFVASYIKWNYNFCLPQSWMWALLSTKLKKETLRWPHGQDEITSRCVHVLGFVYGKREEMPGRVVVLSSCHQARGTASLCMNTRCVLQEDSSENGEVFKSTLFFPCGKIFV